MNYILISRKGDQDVINEYLTGFAQKTSKELVELYNREARIGITGIHRQALYLIALKFEFESRLVDMMFGSFFEEICNSLVDAFTSRAEVVFGSR